MKSKRGFFIYLFPPSKQVVPKEVQVSFVSSTLFTNLGAVHKVSRLGRGVDQKLMILLSKKTTKRGEGSEIAEF